MTESNKTCTGCNKCLPLIEFNDSPNGKDFKKAKCKSCESIYNKKHYELRKLRFKVQKENNRLTNTI